MNEMFGTYAGGMEMPGLSDNEIVSRIKDTGDYTLYSVIVERNKNRLFRLCLGFFAYEEDAEDVLQDIFVKAFEKLERFKGTADFSTWLYRIAINTCLNEKRKGHRRMFLNREYDVEPSWLKGTEEYTPESAMITKDTFVHINNSVARLPDRQKTAYVLSKFDDLSLDEIADIMELGKTAVDSLLQRARRNINSMLGDVLE